MDKVRDCRLGVRGAGAALRAARETGRERGLGDEEEEEEEDEGGRVCRYEVRRWELWIVSGNSSRMSW